MKFRLDYGIAFAVLFFGFMFFLFLALAEIGLVFFIVSDMVSVFGFRKKNKVGNTQMFWLLLSNIFTKTRTFQLFILLCQIGELRCTRSL